MQSLAAASTPGPSEVAGRKPATLKVGRRELVAMVVGALLYGGLSWVTNVFQLQAAPDLQIRPGVAVPIFFGFVFGPVVGFIVGGLGNFINDYASGLLPYPPAVPLGNPLSDSLRAYLANWQIGNGLMGLVPGLAAMSYRRYFSLADQGRALGFLALSVVVGIGFAAVNHPWVDPKVDMNVAISMFFIPVARVDLINAAILVPILLFNYERFDIGSTAWLRSALMRRFLLTILVSAALPVALLGLFLTQQAAGYRAGDIELMVKVGFTVLLSLIFSVANAGLLAQSVSRPLLLLTGSAKSMEEGHLTRQEAEEIQSVRATDEIGRLSHMFGRMALEVISREEKLREQVKQLRIEIDEAKRAREVEEITESDYFQSLQQRARELRGRKADGQ